MRFCLYCVLRRGKTSEWCNGRTNSGQGVANSVGSSTFMKLFALKKVITVGVEFLLALRARARQQFRGNARQAELTKERDTVNVRGKAGVFGLPRHAV